MNQYSLYFISFELVLFTFPILPQSFYNRLAICGIYFFGHVYKIQVYYARFKYYILNNGVNRWDDTVDYNKYFNFTKHLFYTNREKITPITSEPFTTDANCNIYNNKSSPLNNNKTTSCDVDNHINHYTDKSDICWDDESSDSYSESSDVIIM